MSRRRLTAAVWALASLGTLWAIPSHAEGSRVEATGAVAHVLGALREGLEQQVVWLMLEERAEFERRMTPWLVQRFAEGVPERTVAALERELLAHPVPDAHLGERYLGVREDWLLRTVDALKRAIARWTDCHPRSPADIEATAEAASRIAAVFKMWLATSDPVPPPEALESVASRVGQLLLGVPEGSLWAPLLRGITEHEIEDVYAWLLLLEPPRLPTWDRNEYEARVQPLAAALQARLWDMQTSGVSPSAEATELGVRRAQEEQRRALERELEDWHAPGGQDAARAKAQEDAARDATQESYWATVYPFLIQALLCAQDAIEGRRIILP